jgi:PRTRC genetic system protein C
MEVKETIRTFHYNGLEIADPNPSLPLAAVRDILSSQYPELANAKMDTKPAKNGTTETHFTVATGSKG